MLFNTILNRHDAELENIAKNILTTHTIKWVDYFNNYLLENTSGEAIVMNENFYFMNAKIKGLLELIDKEIKMIETYQDELEDYYNRLVDLFYITLKNKLLQEAK